MRPAVGLALGYWEDGWIRVERAELGTDARPPAAIALEWLAGLEAPPLVALDAPLGWPRGLGERLSQHRAGEELGGHPKEFFNRATDRFIHEELGKRPLDVGADRIARTAHAALDLVAVLRGRSGWSLPLCWDPAEVLQTRSCQGGLIEVYPAATLQAHGISADGYKGTKATGRAARERVASEVARRMGGWIDIPRLDTRSDGLDAVLCLLAAQDFLRGEAMPPSSVDEGVEQEGWIWVRTP